MLPLIAFAQVLAMQSVPPLPAAQADAPPGVEARHDKTEPTPGFIARLSAGFGPAMPSAQEDLLSKDGYRGGRWLGLLDVAGRVEGRFLLGGFVAGALRDVDPSRYYGPSLTDDVVFAGVEGMLLAGDGSCRFPLVARLGYARGGESFHGHPSFQNAPVFGAEVGLLCLHFPVGLAAGALFAPAPPPGDLGASWNMGSFYVSAVFDVHD